MELSDGVIVDYSQSTGQWNGGFHEKLANSFDLFIYYSIHITKWEGLIIMMGGRYEMSYIANKNKNESSWLD